MSMENSVTTLFVRVRKGLSDISGILGLKYRQGVQRLLGVRKNDKMGEEKNIKATRVSEIRGARAKGREAYKYRTSVILRSAVQRFAQGQNKSGHKFRIYPLGISSFNKVDCLLFCF